MTAFWDVSTCSLVEVVIVLMIDAVRISETSVYFNETTQHYTLERCRLVLFLFLR